MCIRDRADWDGVRVFVPQSQRVRVKRAGAFERVQRIRGARLHPEDLAACLLYTSDAADDLLCVDLGGRRIIKKKNTQTTQHTQSNKDSTTTKHTTTNNRTHITLTSLTTINSRSETYRILRQSH